VGGFGESCVDLALEFELPGRRVFGDVVLTSLFSCFFYSNHLWSLPPTRYPFYFSVAHHRYSKLSALHKNPGPDQPPLSYTSSGKKCIVTISMEWMPGGELLRGDMDCGVLKTCCADLSAGGWELAGACGLRGESSRSLRNTGLRTCRYWIDLD
jgi:hypothetical protein